MASPNSNIDSRPRRINNDMEFSTSSPIINSISNGWIIKKSDLPNTSWSTSAAQHEKSYRRLKQTLKSDSFIEDDIDAGIPHSTLSNKVESSLLRQSLEKGLPLPYQDHPYQNLRRGCQDESVNLNVSP